MNATVLPRPGETRRLTKNDRSAMRRIEYGVARVVVGVLGRLPVGLAYRLAEWILASLLLLLPRYVRRAREHVDIAFGDEQPEEWRARVAATSFRYLAWYFIDALMAARRLRSAEALARLDTAELEQAFDRGGIGTERGALFVSGHVGVPEVASLAMALGGRPHAVVIRKLDNGFLWDWVLREREGIPRQAITKAGALRTAYKLLTKKGIVGIQIDQDAGSAGLFVPYFGRPASTTAGAATLALTARVPVYMVFGVRTAPRAARYRVLCSGPLVLETTGDHGIDAAALTAAMTAEIEAAARQYPEQVMWAHRRWKTAPPAD